MLPTLLDNTLNPKERERYALPTDNVARARFNGIKKYHRDKYSNLPISFDDCWSLAFSNAQKEFIQKIDIYQKGIDFSLYESWLNFSTNLGCTAESAPLCDEFKQAISAWKTRFKNRLAKNKNIDKAKLSDIENELEKTCQNLTDYLNPTALLNPDTAIIQKWEDFCNQIQKYYPPKSVWNWFTMFLRYRFVDELRKTLPPPPPDPTKPPKPPKPEKVRKNRSIPQESMQLIQEDTYGIFAGKYIKNHPEINFQAIALFQPSPSKNRKKTEEMKAYFGGKVDAKSTISSFRSRCVQYFEPFFKENTSEDTNLPLPRELLDEITADVDGKFARRRMPKHNEISFKLIIEKRKHLRTWQLVARELQLEMKDLLYFYLDCVQKFKLLPQEKTRTRRTREQLKNPTESGDN